MGATSQSRGLEFAVLHAVPAPAALVDRDGLIRLVNHAWQGAAAANALPGSECGVGASYLELCEKAAGNSLEKANMLAGGMHAVLAGQQDTFVVEYPYYSPGKEQWFRFAVAPLREGWFDGAVILYLNLTEQKRASAALRESDLQTQKMEELGRLASGLAHDFANLMTLICGYSEILLDRMGPADSLRPDMEEIRKAANRGAAMTARLLDFIRSQMVQPKVLDLNALVSDMQKMLQPMIGDHIELATTLAPDLGKIKADASQMTRVIMNLVLNARDAMPEGGKITIATDNLELDPMQAGLGELTPGAYIKLALTDTGKGMDAETMNHLFEPFFTTKEKGRGTGLGLTTVYGIVKQSRGDVWVQSEPGMGTTFTICLPRVAETGEVLGPQASASSPAPETETILLVEHEDAVRRLVKHIFASRGYQVLEANDGPEALRIHQEYSGPIHLLLTDVVMPGMSGPELVQRMRDLRPNLKSVYMSGYTDELLIRSGVLGPGVPFLQKPLKPELLARRIREVLDGPSQ